MNLEDIYEILSDSRAMCDAEVPLEMKRNVKFVGGFVMKYYGCPDSRNIVWLN
jgi:hypothetical protein